MLSAAAFRETALSYLACWQARMKFASLGANLGGGQTLGL